MMGHVGRLAIGSAMLIVVLILGLFLDAAVMPIIEVAYDFGVDQGPLSPVLSAIENGAMVLIVPMLMLGIVLWMVWGGVEQEQQEEIRHRMP